MESTSSATVAVAPKKKKTWKKIKQYKWLYIFLIPGMLYILVFKYIPIIWNVIAFQDYDSHMAEGFAAIFNSPWIGLENFRYIFTESSEFWPVFWNTLKYGVYKLVWSFPAPILLALVLNEIRCMWYKKVCQTIVYLPHFISFVVMAGIVQFMLSDQGAFNAIIRHFGGETILFLTEPKYFWTILVATIVFKGVGYGTVVYMAALSGVNEELYESAAIDGATRIQMARYITLPSIVPTIITVFIINVGNVIKGGLDEVLMFQNPAIPPEASEVIQTYTYKTGLRQGKYSYATAVGLFESVIAITLMFVTNYIARKNNQKGLW